MMEFKHESCSSSTRKNISNKETIKIPFGLQDQVVTHHPLQLKIKDGDLLCISIANNWLLGYSQASQNSLVLYPMTITNTDLWPCIFCYITSQTNENNFVLRHEETGLYLAAFDSRAKIEQNSLF